MSSLQQETVVALIAAHDWFSSIAKEDLDRLAAAAETVEWEPGTVVFEEGDVGEHCYLLHSGSVKVLHLFPDGRRVTLARLGPGHVVGELALFNSDRRSATVEAVESTLAVRLSGTEVMAVLRRDANAAMSVVSGLAARLRESNERVLEHALSTVTGRVVATLLGQVEARQAQGARERDVEVLGSAVDVARLAGAPRESATRTLHWLENEGVITLKRGKTVVHDPAALGRYLS
jgi:CRP-like cAMP-binding protein